ncbi:MAG: substrate-binding domain-containing protein [Eubacteriales bacterium]|nr:substrate-binding domain-containing protein [Eubacteriales bacterium]
MAMKKKGRTAARWILSVGMIAFLGAGLPRPTVAEEEEKETLPPPVEIDTDLNMVPGARIAVVTKNTSGSFWSSVKQGMEDAIADINEVYALEKDDKLTMTFEGPNEETKVTDQINTIDAVLAENPQVLCLSAADMESCEAQLESARENGIPVIMFDSDVESDIYTAFCGTDNAKAGTLAAEQMAEALNHEGEIVIFAHQGKTVTSTERVKAFQKKLEEYPDMKVTEVLYSDEEEDMKASMKKFLEENEEISGVFCTNGEISQLFLEVQNELEDRELTFIGVDTTQEQQEAILDGRELGTVAQQPYAIGYQTIYQAVRALCGASVEQEILLDTAWIDAQALETPEEYAEYLAY